MAEWVTKINTFSRAKIDLCLLILSSCPHHRRRFTRNSAVLSDDELEVPHFSNAGHSVCEGLCFCTCVLL